MIGPLQLVPDWRRAWRWASVQMAPLNGLLVYLLTEHSTALQGLVPYLPEQWRPIASIVFALLATIAPVLARILKRKTTEPNDERPEAQG